MTEPVELINPEISSVVMTEIGFRGEKLDKHYLAVVLRSDQIELIAQAVFDKIRSSKNDS